MGTIKIASQDVPSNGSSLLQTNETFHLIGNTWENYLGAYKPVGTLKVRIVLHFLPDHKVLPTGGHVPNGYWKHITFPDGRKECFYFPNSVPTKHWSEYEIQCQVNRRSKTII